MQDIFIYLSPSSMLIHILHVHYFKEHLQFPLLQHTLVYLPTDKHPLPDELVKYPKHSGLGIIV